MSETPEMVERVAKAIDAVQIFSRFNDWTSDKVDGLPIEICRHGEYNGDPVIIKRFPASKGEDAALREVVSEMRARAAMEAMRPTDVVIRKAQWAYEREITKAVDDGLSDEGLSEARFGAIKAAIDAALATPGEGT